VSHQGPHGAVQRVAVVPAELGVGALERGETVRLGLLDAVPVSVPPRSVIL
jgi:hypothetical protein